MFRDALAWGWGLACASAAAADPGPARRAELLHMVRQDCGSCHGLTLKGGLGPSLEPASLANKDAEALEFVILRGRPGTAMPPWSPFLTAAETRWVVRQLKQGLPQ
jgi:cytochrome c55X